MLPGSEEGSLFTVLHRNTCSSGEAVLRLLPNPPLLLLLNVPWEHSPENETSWWKAPSPLTGFQPGFSVRSHFSLQAGGSTLLVPAAFGLVLNRSRASYLYTKKGRSVELTLGFFYSLIPLYALIYLVSLQPPEVTQLSLVVCQQWGCWGIEPRLRAL